MKIQLKRHELNKFWFVVLAVIFAIGLFLVMFYTGYTERINEVIALASVVISIYLCYVYRFNIGMLIVMLMISYSNYSIAIGVYLNPSVRPAALYGQFKNLDTYGIGIMCILIFELVLLILSGAVIKNPHIIDVKKDDFFVQKEDNTIIAYGALVVYCIMFFGEVSFGASAGGRLKITATSEYKTIIQIIGLYYSAEKKQFKYIWTVLVGITTLLTFVGGNRVEALGNIFALVIFCFYDFIDYKKLLLMLPFGVVLLSGIGFMRTDFSLSVETVRNVVSRMFEDGLTYEGAIFAYLPSLSTIEISPHISADEKWRLFWIHIEYFFLKIGGSKFLYNNLAYYSRNYFLHYGGFISPSYFFFWFEYLGAVIFALLVNIYIKFYIKSTRKRFAGFSEKLMYILSSYFMCNVGRWYCYAPMYLIRNMCLCAVVYMFVYFIDNVIRGKK